MEESNRGNQKENVEEKYGALPALGRLGSEHRVRPGTKRSPREERAPLGVPRRLANALPLSIFVQRPRCLAKFSQHKDQHLETAPGARRGAGFSQADVSAVDELGGVVGDAPIRRGQRGRSVPQRGTGPPGTTKLETIKYVIHRRW